MCDFFWLSPADQGDLSDVVRASLQQLPTVATPPAAASSSHEWLGAAHADPPPEEDEELMLLQGCHDEVVHLKQQLLHGNDMELMLSNYSSSCDPLLLQPSPSYPQPETERLIGHVMLAGPPPQLLVGDAGVECDVAAPEMEEHGVDMAPMDAHPHALAIKRRKNQTKKVVCIPAPTAAPPGMGGRPSTSGEVVPSDLWAWRKYGQKPIKGSPYPRGYYRCSSSKGCSARKQVERSRTDPSMLVITYTSDHNHPWPTQRNVLAGSTRLPASSSSAAATSHGGHHQHHSASTATGVPLPPPPTTVVGRHHTTSIVALSSTCCDDVHRRQVPKQEVLDDVMMDHPAGAEQGAAADHQDLGMFAGMDGVLSILPASNFNSQKQQQQHATASEDDGHLEEQDDKQQLFDPFSFSFFDWVGASFGIGDTNNGGYI